LMPSIDLDSEQDPTTIGLARGTPMYVVRRSAMLLSYA
jgi:hypothetical protein